MQGVEVERQILETLRQHPGIIRLVGRHKDGMSLEYLLNGSVERCLRNVAPSASLGQRLQWGRQGAEDLAYNHGKSVLHCDFSVGKLLLDDDLSIELCAFRGRLLGPNEAVILNGGAVECVKSSMPRLDRTHYDRKPDMLAPRNSTLSYSDFQTALS